MNKEIIVISNMESHKFLGPGMSLFSFFDLKKFRFDWGFKKYGLQGGVFDQLIHHQYSLLDDYERVFINKDLSIENKTYNDMVGQANGLYINGFLLSQHLQDAGWSTHIIMNAATELNHLKNILKRKPFAVVISTTFMLEASKVRRLAKLIKKISPSTYVIAGGSKVVKNYKAHQEVQLHPIGKYLSIKDRIFLLNSQFFTFPILDRHIDAFIPVYPGWKTLLELLDLMYANKKWVTHKNIIAIDKLRNKLVQNTLERDITTINEDVVDWAKAYTENERFFTYNTQSIEFGRGCPLTCSFCDFTTSIVTHKSLDNFVRELDSIASLPFITHLRFTDENLLSSKRKANDFVDVMMRFKGRFTWDSTSSSIVHIDDEIADKLSETGCIYLESSLESGDNNLLKEHINKPIYPEKFMKKVELLNKYNIDTRISFIVCHPGEKIESVKNTLSVIAQIPSSGPGFNYVEFHKFFLSLDTAYLNTLDGRKKYGLRGVSFKWKTDDWDYKKADDVFLQIVETLGYPATVNNIFFDKSMLDYKKKNHAQLRILLENTQKYTVAQFTNKKIQQEYYSDNIIKSLNRLLPEYKLLNSIASKNNSNYAHKQPR